MNKNHNHHGVILNQQLVANINRRLTRSFPAFPLGVAASLWDGNLSHGDAMTKLDTRLYLKPMIQSSTEEAPTAVDIAVISSPHVVISSIQVRGNFYVTKGIEPKPSLEALDHLFSAAKQQKRDAKAGRFQPIAKKTITTSSSTTNTEEQQAMNCGPLIETPQAPTTHSSLPVGSASLSLAPNHSRTRPLILDVGMDVLAAKAASSGT